MLESMVGTFVPKGVNSRGVLEEVKTRFREELDYRLEAERQTQFSRIFAGDPQIRIPADAAGVAALTLASRAPAQCLIESARGAGASLKFARRGAA